MKKLLAVLLIPGFLAPSVPSKGGAAPIPQRPVLAIFKDQAILLRVLSAKQTIFNRLAPVRFTFGSLVNDAKRIGNVLAAEVSDSIEESIQAGKARAIWRGDGWTPQPGDLPISSEILDDEKLLWDETLALMQKELSGHPKYSNLLTILDTSQVVLLEDKNFLYFGTHARRKAMPHLQIGKASDRANLQTNRRTVFLPQGAVARMIQDFQEQKDRVPLAANSGLAAFSALLGHELLHLYGRMILKKRVTEDECEKLEAVFDPPPKVDFRHMGFQETHLGRILYQLFVIERDKRSPPSASTGSTTPIATSLVLLLSDVLWRSLGVLVFTGMLVIRGLSNDGSSEAELPGSGYFTVILFAMVAFVLYKAAGRADDPDRLAQTEMDELRASLADTFQKWGMRDVEQNVVVTYILDRAPLSLASALRQTPSRKTDLMAIFLIERSVLWKFRKVTLSLEEFKTLQQVLHDFVDQALLGRSVSVELYKPLLTPTMFGAVEEADRQVKTLRRMELHIPAGPGSLSGQLIVEPGASYLTAGLLLQALQRWSPGFRSTRLRVVEDTQASDLLRYQPIGVGDRLEMEINGAWVALPLWQVPPQKAVEDPANQTPTFKRSFWDWLHQLELRVRGHRALLQAL